MERFTTTLPFPIPQLTYDEGEYLYLMLDGSQINELDKIILMQDSYAEYEAIYLYEPWCGLRAVSPFIVQATPKMQQWFMQHNNPTHGYFFSSSQPLEHLAEHFRKFIQVESPYGSRVFFKIGASEAAAVLFKTQNTAIWCDITTVWLPTRLGWIELTTPSQRDDLSSSQLLIKLTEEQWALLGDVQWLNILESLQHHIEKWFPHLISTHTPNTISWIDSWASLAYRKGFVLEQDLLYYSNIIGLLGEDFALQNEYHEVNTLLMTPSLQTHSQRVEQAAHIAHRLKNKSNPL
ncbi:DUF4123 domain-containing protein [Photobacterium damselae]|nr:DUF4123 domain-containing protein [Photobacterium damselae]